MDVNFYDDKFNKIGNAEKVQFIVTKDPKIKVLLGVDFMRTGVKSIEFDGKSSTIQFHKVDSRADLPNKHEKLIVSEIEFSL